MTQPYRIEPDLDFVRDVIGSGGDTLKKCFQCATCSVVCPLSPPEEPFPRKEMIQAQWGLKDKLVKDPDIWLCHNCNDCSTYCPRGAKPGDVMNALRKKAIEHYATPQAIAKRVGDPKSLPLLIAIPAILIAVLIGLTNLWWHGEGPTRVVHGETIVLDEVHPFLGDDPHVDRGRALHPDRPVCGECLRKGCASVLGRSGLRADPEDGLHTGRYRGRERDRLPQQLQGMRHQPGPLSWPPGGVLRLCGPVHHDVVHLCRRLLPEFDRPRALDALALVESGKASRQPRRHLPCL